MEKIIRLTIYLLVFVTIASCNEKFTPITDSEFLEMSSWGLYSEKNQNTYVFNEDDSQIAQNKIRNTIRFQKDDQSSYMHIQELDLASESQTYLLNITLYYNSTTTTIAYEMINVKSTEDKIWLWSSENSIGLILPNNF